MKLFRKKKKASEPNEITIEKKQTHTYSLRSGRMAALYQKMYRWIISVNITRDVYQIESGADELGGEPLPARGYYHTLLERLAACMSEDGQRLLQRFGAENVRRLAQNGWSSVSDVFCCDAQEDAEEPWVELRLEWTGSVKNLVCVLSIRPVRNDLDDGQRESLPATPVEAVNAQDWDTIRAKAIAAQPGVLLFEYQVAEDRLTLHRTPGDPAGDMVCTDFVKALHSGTQPLVSGESAAALAAVLEGRNDHRIESMVLSMRRDGTRGGHLRRYRFCGHKIEKDAQVAWVLGWLEDIEEQMQEQERTEELSRMVSLAMHLSKMSLYLVDCGKNQILRIRQNGTGYMPEGTPTDLSAYLRSGIDSGRIHPQDGEKYLPWLEKDYLRRKTAKGVYSFDTRIKGLADEDYLWYQESMIPVEGKSNLFLRLCRENTAGHLIQEDEYRAKEREQLAAYNEQMLDMLAGLLEFRSANSTGHIEHVRQLTRIILEDIAGRSVKYNLTPQQIDRYVQAATMHDIGKITVPDQILNKPGRLTPEEMAVMRRHTTDGAEIIERICLPGQEELRQCIYDVVLHHHERVDGNGYPDGMKGEELSIGVQAVSLADVYDALVSERCYKDKYDYDEAMRMILEGECGVFSEEILETLRACGEQMRSVYADK